MNNPFKAISLSHKSAPLEIREHFALNSSSCRRLLQYAKGLGCIDEMLVISTCNRFEVYFTSHTLSCKQFIRLLKLFAREIKFDDPLQHFQMYTLPVLAVEHLFRVSIGLESQVLGDAQIINQVKEAYQNSVDLNLAGPFLHRLLHTIFHTHKRVIRESCFKHCHASVTQVTKKLTNHLLPDKDATILILGTGKIGESLCRTLCKMGYKVWVSNRTEEKSLLLAAELDLKPIPLNDVHHKLKEAQMVISALSIEEPFLTSKNIKTANLNNHKYFIDLSVPRSVGPELAKHSNITLFNMDDIDDAISATVQKRRNEVYKVEAIIKSELSEFYQWADELRVMSTIQQIKKALERIREEEIARHLKNICHKETEIVNDITKSIVERFIKLPALKLRMACKKGEEAKMMKVLNEIFSI